MLDYTQIEFPLTFEDIFILWVGEKKYGEIKSDGPYICDDYLSLIRSVENQLDSAIRNNHIRLYSQRVAAGRTFYYEIPYNHGELFAGTRPGYGDELYKCFQFMRHHPNIIGAKSEPLYFDRNEIFTYFPFLNSVGQESPSANGGKDEGERIPLNIPASLWAGKTAEQARDALKNDYGPEVIAVILAKISDNKTECGRILSQDEIDKDIERDARTYQKRFDDFILQANSKYLFTFNG